MEDEATLRKAPFFIFGCGRSGTSLLSRMLNHHPAIAVPYESHLFNTFYSLLKFYGDLNKKENLKRLLSDILKTDVMRDWDPQIELDDVLARVNTNDFKGIFDAILESWTVANNKQRWGEKTPHHVDYWKELSEFYPTAKIIHIYRDGRDVGLSLQRARFGPKTAYTAAKYWKSYLERIDKVKAIAGSENICELSYENLLENPELHLKKICEFIGESYSEQMLEFHQTKAVYNTDSQNRANLQKPLLKNNSQKWRSAMTTTEISQFESVAGAYLDKYGYERAAKEEITTTGFSKIQLTVKALILKNLARFKNAKGINDGLIRLQIHIGIRMRYYLLGKR